MSYDAAKGALITLAREGAGSRESIEGMLGGITGIRVPASVLESARELDELHNRDPSAG